MVCKEHPPRLAETRTTMPNRDPLNGSVDPDADDTTTPAATPEPDTPATGRQSEPGGDTTTPADDVDTVPEVDPNETPPADDVPAEPTEPSVTVPAVYLDEVKGNLFRALVTIDGRLADPDALDYDEALLDDPAAREAAITALLDRNPRLGRHGVAGDVGTGPRGSTPRPPADLIQMIRDAQAG